MKRRIVCYGDSNTYGYDPRGSFGGRYPETVRWTGRLSACWDVVNEGGNGRTIPRWDGEIDVHVRMICRRGADVVTVMLGTNDLLQEGGLTPQACGARMERFLSALPRGGAAVLLIAPPPMERGLWVEDDGLVERSRALAPSYAEVARRMGIAFADAGEWGVALSYDGIHFSEDGHCAFAHGVEKALGCLVMG